MGWEGLKQMAEQKDSKALEVAVETATFPLLCPLK